MLHKQLPKDESLARTMTAVWVHLAKTGDPNGPALPEWPRYDVRTAQYIEFGGTIRAGSHLLDGELEAWAEAFRTLRVH
jgi:carboxylesterase type B